VLRLSANDTQFTTDSDATITVTAPPIGDLTPVVNAGAAQLLYMDGSIFPLTATLQGSASDDGLPNGTLTTQWSQFSGTAPVTFSAPTSTTTSVTLPLPGSYTLALTANDGQLSTTAFVQITVLLNHAPVVKVAPDQNIVSSGPVTTTISGTASDDGLPVGSTLTVGWAQGQFQQAAIVNPSQLTTQVQLPGPGFYEFTLSASDGVLSSNATQSITVVSVPPAVPAVSITSPAEEDEIHKPVPVIGSASGGKWTLDYRLNNDDGAATTSFITLATGTSDVTNGTLGTLDPSLLLNGLYTLRLTATNSVGQSSTVSVNVTVSRNRKLGFFTISFNDLSVPMPGFPVQVVRTYDSRDPHQGDFGFGWTLSLANIRLQKSRNFTSFWEETVDATQLIPQYCVFSDNHKFVTITFPDGKVYKFEAALSPQCQLAGPIVSPTVSFNQLPGEAGTAGATLAPADDIQVLIDGSVPGTFNLVQADGSSYNPTVFKLTTADGFSYVIDQATGLKSVTDTNGNTLTVTPDGLIHSSGKSVVFQRDAQGRIASITDPQGNKLYYGYEPRTGDLQSFADQAGNTWFYNYAPAGSLSPPHMLQVITDPRGVDVLQNAYSSSTNQLIQTADAAGRLVQLSYQPASNQETIKDRNGNSTTYTYDDDGNVVAVLDALGHTSSMTYDALGNKLTETRTGDDGRTRTTTSTYDGRSNLTSETDPLGNVTSYTYNDRRKVTNLTDPRGKVMQGAYDSQGNLLSTTDSLNHTTTFVYLPNGLPKAVTGALGNVTSFFYDLNGNLTRQSDALGNVSTFTYDTLNRKLSQTVSRTKSDGTMESLTTRYAYDIVGRLVKTTNPDGTSTQTAYDALSRRTSTTDAKGNVTQYDYDTAGRISRIGYPDQTEDTFQYDPEGHRTQVSSHGLPGHIGLVTNYSYDAVGRLIQTTNAEGARSTTQYDALGQVASTTDALNHVTSYAYDDAGRRISVTDALGNVSKYAYDAAGNQISFTDALSHTMQSVYDDAARRIKTIYPDQSTESVTYDVLGRPTAKTDQAGKVTQWSYDALGRLVSVTDALGQVTSYSYDELGNRLTQTDANQHTTSFVYDQLGRRIQRSLPLGQSESYSYDTTGNLTSKMDFNGHATTYSYDNMNRLTAMTADAFFAQGACAGGACGTTQVSYTYTPTGRRASMTDASGTTSYTYDRVDRPLVKSTPFGDVRSFWDRAGNQLSLNSPSVSFGASMSYIYDADNRLASVTDAVGSTNYSYDAVGNLSGVTYPNGVSTSYAYNTLNRLTNMQSICGTAAGSTAAPGCGPIGTPIASYTYTLGAAGNRLSVVELSGRTVNYGYDDLYRLSNETVAGASAQNGTIAYQYDPVGNRKQLSSTVAAIPSGLMNYDANDRVSTDVYDNNGNTINNSGIGNVYDFENHLVQHGNVQIVYDGDGNRVSETFAGITTNYLVADVNPTGYAQVIDEVQGTVSVRSYAYGLERINQKHLARVGTTNVFVPNFYGYDGHGSVRYLMDSTGAVTDTYDYDAFGILINSTGTTPNNYLFAGEQFDQALGIYYNRARYYDEKSGRFWSIDDFEGNSQDPGTLHRYLYARNNPANRIDPSGNADLTLGETVIVSAIIGTLSGAVLGAIAHGWKGAAIGAGIGLLGGIVLPLLGAVVTGGLVAFGVGASTATFIPMATFATIGVFLGVQSYRKATTNRERIAAVLGIVLSLVAFARAYGNWNPESIQVPPDPNILSGHGVWDPANGYTVVPEGTTVTLPTGVGNTISDAYGNALETGADPSSFFAAEGEGAVTYLPGSRIPNLTLLAPKGLNIAGNPTTVTAATNLQQLLQPNMGNVIWAACCEVK
jgi:RHS repeat-associated protein